MSTIQLLHGTDHIIEVPDINIGNPHNDYGRGFYCTRVVAEVELLVPSYGFCRIPPCEEFASEVCDGFFSLPIFPPEMTSDCGCGCCGN